MQKDETRALRYLREAATWACEAELANERIDECDVYVLVDAVIVRARRNGHLSLSPRRVSHSDSITWNDLECAETNPFRTMIDRVVERMNAPPTTHLRGDHAQ